jgi:hypothetical protein
MPGFANLFYFGQPDPAQQLARMLSGQQQPPQQQQPGAPGAAPPNGPAPGPADGSAPTPPPPVAPGSPPPPGSPPIPTALQSTPDMSQSYAQLANPPNIMSLYVQMAQRDQAMQGINSAFAQIAANHSPPSMRSAIMQNANAGAGDAGSMMGNLMSLYQNQQQMGATQALLARSPEIAQKLGMDEGIVRAQILAGRGSEFISALEPTQATRDIQAKHDMFIKSGGTEDDWKANYLPMILAGGIPGMTGDQHSMMLARTQWNNDPANAGKPTPGYLSDPEKWKIFNQDLTDAKQQFGGLNQSLGKFIGDMGEVANNPSLDKITGSTGGVLSGAIEGLLPGEVNNLKTQMTGLSNEAKDMSSRGGPKGVGQNIKTLGSSPEDFTNASLTNYRDTVIAPRMRQALTAQANAYGASGQANTMPGYLRNYVDQNLYGAGGELDIGGAPKKVTPDTGPDGKPLPQPDAAHLQDFYTALEHRGPKFALDGLKAAGFDTSSLR